MPTTSHGATWHYVTVGGRLKVKLLGREAKLGRVAARDVAQLLLGVERAIARASGHVIGREVKATGRWGVTIEAASRLRLVAVKKGSVVGVLELPEFTEMPLGISAATMGELALDKTLAILMGEDGAEPDVAESLASLADEIGIGTRYEALELETDVGKYGRQVIRLDPAVRNRLKDAAAKQPPLRPDTVVGVLVEADFERESARLRTPSNARVSVSFDHSLDDEIQRALRQQSELVGEVTYDPESMTAVSLRVRKIRRADQLPLGIEGQEFWLNRSVSELAAESGIKPITDFESLHDTKASPEEVDAFLAAIAD